MEETALRPLGGYIIIIVFKRPWWECPRCCLRLQVQLVISNDAMISDFLMLKQIDSNENPGDVRLLAPSGSDTGSQDRSPGSARSIYHCQSRMFFFVCKDCQGPNC